MKRIIRGTFFCPQLHLAFLATRPTTRVLRRPLRVERCTVVHIAAALRQATTGAAAASASADAAFATARRVAATAAAFATGGLLGRVARRALDRVGTGATFGVVVDSDHRAVTVTGSVCCARGVVHGRTRWRVRRAELLVGVRGRRWGYR